MNLPDVSSTILFHLSSLPELATFLSKVTLLLATAWLLYFALARANPRWRVFLWREVAVGLAVSSIWSIGLPRLDIRVAAPLQTATAEILASSHSSISDENPSIRHSQIAGLPAEAISSTEMPTTPIEDLPGKAQGPSRSIANLGLSFSWQTIAVIVWGLGVSLLFLRLIIGQLRIRYFLQTSRPTPEHVGAKVKQISAELGCCSTVTVRCSQQCAVPFLTGALRPVIILPARMCEPNFLRDLPAVLAHELAHVRSSDVAWNIAIHIASLLLWFHPLVWRIGAVHQVACDAVSDAVSATLLGDVQAYCRILAKVALDACSFGNASALAMAQSCDVRRRVTALQQNVFELPLRRRAVAATCLFGLLSLSFLAGVRLTAAQPESKDISTSLTTAEETQPRLRPMTIHVLDTQQKPIANAKITVRAMVDVSEGPVRYRTNAEGIARIQVPDHERLDLQLLILSKRRVTVGASWRGTAVRNAIPSEFTVEMEPGTSFGGIVHDEQGQPVSGAKVKVNGRKKSGDGVLWFSINDSPTTDENGRWQCDRIPADLAGFEVDVKVRHPDFSATPAVDYKSLSLDKLRDRSAVLIMHAGLAIEGMVTDPQGRPVAGAMVGQYGQYINHHTDAGRATTDENGQYRLPPSDPGDYVLAVVADGFAPNSRSVSITAEQRSFDLQLQQGESIRLRIVDQEGKPIARAVIATGSADREILFLDNTRGALSGDDRNLTTDAEGRWSRLWIPEDPLTFYIRKNGYESVQKSLKPDEQEQIVTLRAGNWNVSGRVVDRATKVPVTKFNVVEGYTNGNGENVRSWRESLLVEDDDGKYRASWNTSGEARRVIRIEAEGYLPSQAQPLKPDEMQVVHNFEMEKGDTVTGVVVTQDGKPLSNADVTLCTPTRGLYLQESEPACDRNSLIVRTGAEGQFSFAAPGEPFALIVTHDQGFARVEGDADTKKITLQPWARVEGTLRIRNTLAPDESLTLSFDEPHRDNSTPRVHYDYRTTTDEKGHFAFEKIVPGKGQVIRNVVVEMGRWGMSKWIPTHVTKTTFVAGETAQVQLGRTGRPVVGKLEMPDNRSDYDWKHAMASLQVVPHSGSQIKPPPIPIPKDIDPQKDREAAMKWWKGWKDTKEGQQYTKDMQRYQAAIRAVRPVSFGTNIEPTGDFTFEDLPAGDYQLTVVAVAEPKDGQIHPGQAVANLSLAFKVPKISVGNLEGPFDLGALTLKAILRPNVPE